MMKDAGIRRGKTIQWFILFVLIAAIAVFCVMLGGTDPLDTARQYGLRIAIIILALAGWFRSQKLISSCKMQGGGISDGLHELSAPLHRRLLDHPRTANGILIASSAFIDAFGIFLIAAGIFGPTMRPFLALIILFIFRQACQALCALPVPRDMIWRNPGFPSLLVTYGVANDFFFSGHTAIAVLGAMEIAKIAPEWVGILAFAIALMEAAVVVVLRAHYTMDVICAVFAAWFASGIAAWLSGLL